MSDGPQEICRRVCGAHEIYCCGSHVRILEEGVTALTEPLVKSCPLHEILYGTKKVDAKTVQNSVGKKIQDFGFCCRDRCFDPDPQVAYGASEMMNVWLERGFIDCAVVVCEGAGTVLTSNGKLVQGIGARLTGIIKTSSILGTIEHVSTAAESFSTKLLHGLIKLQESNALSAWASSILPSASRVFKPEP